MNINDIILTIDDLRKNYGGKSVLNGISLQVKRGEIIGYIGANGAGKSTTVKILLGIESDYSGKVTSLAAIFLTAMSNIRGKSAMYRRLLKCMTILEQAVSI